MNPGPNIQMLQRLRHYGVDVALTVDNSRWRFYLENDPKNIIADYRPAQRHLTIHFGQFEGQYPQTTADRAIDRVLLMLRPKASPAPPNVQNVPPGLGHVFEQLMAGGYPEPDFGPETREPEEPTAAPPSGLTIVPIGLVYETFMRFLAHREPPFYDEKLHEAAEEARRAIYIFHRTLKSPPLND